MERHISVLTREAVEGLAFSRGATVVDCTAGNGGHAEAILDRLEDGTLIAIDADPSATQGLQHLTKRGANVELVTDNFRNIARILAGRTPNAILADLGWRTEQFADPTRGFSFQGKGPLVMTYGDPEHYPFTAYDIVNEWEEESIADVVYGYGEERFARRIASAIIDARKSGEIATASDLASVVAKAIPAPFRYGRINPATKTFQALRIAVNDELGALRQLLEDGFEALAPNGRLAIISFHSLEDRIVKHFFQTKARDQKGTRISKKPITATPEELQTNPRARSAKLRIIEKHP